MKNLKQLLATGTMMAALMVGTTFAGTGLLVSDLADSDPCSEESNAAGILLADFAGLLVSDFAGLLVSDYTGIIVHGVTDEEPVCGIIVHG
jgi:hypothetical protein